MKAVAEGVFVYKVNAAGKLVSLRAFWEFEKMMANLAAPPGTSPGTGRADASAGEGRTRPASERPSRARRP
jgi:hypothetical protein